MGIADRADVPVASLGLGSCRLVELARALVSDPVLLLADEPSSGLDVRETAELAAVLRTLQRERGLALLLVEHDLGMVGEVVDRAIVMDLGTVIAEGPFDTVMADPAVRHAYLGVDGVTRPSRPASGRLGADATAPALQVDHVSAAYGPYRALFDVTFAVPAGGITALIGSNGAGKSTVARVVTGLLASYGGDRPGRRHRRDRAGRPTGSPGSDAPTCPRAGASSPTSPSRRT